MYSFIIVYLVGIGCTSRIDPIPLKVVEYKIHSSLPLYINFDLLGPSIGCHFTSQGTFD